MGVESHYSSKKTGYLSGHHRALQAQDELARLRALPRVRKGNQIKFIDGPQAYSVTTSSPRTESRRRCTSTSRIRPGGKSQKHGHVNEAAFYILDGKGYEIHDGIRYDWQAGDIAVVHNNCVHQHSTPIPPSRRARSC